MKFFLPADSDQKKKYTFVEKKCLIKLSFECNECYANVENQWFYNFFLLSRYQAINKEYVKVVFGQKQEK